MSAPARLASIHACRVVPRRFAMIPIGWRQNALLRREPTLPVSFGTTVATGDLEGYLHFFNNSDGEPVARLSTGGQAISIPPVVVADLLYVQSDSGKLIAYEIRLPKKARSETKASDEDT